MLNEDGTLLSYEHFCNKYFTPMYTVFLGLRSCIREACNLRLANAIERDMTMPYCEKYLYVILNNKHGNSIYDSLVESILYEKRYIDKWNIELEIQGENWNWKKTNLLIKLPLEVRLKWFQYRIIHRILSTNSFLYKIGLSDSPVCTFCNHLPETISHLFFECRVVNTFIGEVSLWLTQTNNEYLVMSKIEFILGDFTKSRTANMVSMIMKYYIYKVTAQRRFPEMEDFKRHLKQYYHLEYIIHKKSLSLETLEKKWGSLNDLLKE